MNINRSSTMLLLSGTEDLYTQLADLNKNTNCSHCKDLLSLTEDDTSISNVPILFDDGSRRLHLQLSRSSQTMCDLYLPVFMQDCVLDLFRGDAVALIRYNGVSHSFCNQNFVDKTSRNIGVP
jgi:hypothetical protein